MQILTLEDSEEAENFGPKRGQTFRRENGAEILEIEEGIEENELGERRSSRPPGLEVLEEVEEEVPNTTGIGME